MTEILERFFAGQLGGLTVMLVTAALIVFFLRVLYGPKGLFRDPRWDTTHRRLRQRETERREERIKAIQEGRQDPGHFNDE